MAGNNERLRMLWEQGIALWERDQAYLDAMDVLERAVLELPDVASSVLGNDSDDHNNNDGSLSRQHLPTRISSETKCDTTATLTETSVTPLLLFLAGCFLDAGKFDKAKLYCRAAWQFASKDDPNNNNHSLFIELNHRILSEYMACFEEDPNQQEPWTISFQIVQQALEQQQQQKESSAKQKPWLLWHNPYQRPAFCYPIPFSDEDHHPEWHMPVCPREQHPLWCRALEDQFEMIRNEYLELSSSSSSCDDNNNHATTHHHQQQPPSHWPLVGSGSHRDGAGAHDGTVVGPGGEWREWVLFGSGASDGVLRHRQAPCTRAWLRQHAPDAVSLAEQGGGEIIFSVLRAGTTLAPHCASTNLRWTAHLGLIVPSTSVGEASDGPKIRVADQWHTWQEGRVLVFDDSYEHQVVVPDNVSGGVRVVLLLRFWHPGIPRAQRGQALQQALEWKRLDEYRRYHPPRPPGMS